MTYDLREMRLVFYQTSMSHALGIVKNTKSEWVARGGSWYLYPPPAKIEFPTDMLSAPKTHEQILCRKVYAEIQIQIQIQTWIDVRHATLHDGCLVCCLYLAIGGSKETGYIASPA